jgi:hypothetical protein
MIALPIAVKGNSFCFIHDTAVPAGSGADSAIGIRINCPAIVQENIFISCGNAAISLFVDPARVAVDRNLFFLTPRDALVGRLQGNAAEITEKNLEEMEDIGVKSSTDNVAQNPEMKGVRAEWLDAYSRHLLANYAKPPRDTVNAVRTAAGLPVIDPADRAKPEQPGALAPRLTVADALALSFSAKQGHHAVELAAIGQVRTAAILQPCRPIDWNLVVSPDSSLANVRVELRAGLGTEQNTALVADAAPETHLSVCIYQPGSDDVSIYVLIPRYTLPARQFDEAIRYSRGLDVECTYLIRGIYRTDLVASRQKVTLIVDSIRPGQPLSATLPIRPIGRDWFVKAGSSGGDGTREKPFRDPFQALDHAEGGDTIHVASGEYFGKLRSGRWNITIRNLALLGGYDANFSSRDPWNNPTRFSLTEEERAKGRPGGTILFSEENSDGLIVDGFIFDGATWNTYGKDGSLDTDKSPDAPLVSLRGGRAPIAVRNCLFLNGSSGALTVSCPYAIIENNVLINTAGDALVLRAEGPGPCSIRNNIVLFACDPTPRAGTGQSSSGGTLLQLSGRARVDLDSNVFGFADNYGIRVAMPQQNVSFENNRFAANLFKHLTDAGYLWVDGATWARRALMDTDFAAFAGNKLELPSLAVDPAFGDVALARLRALNSLIPKDDWNSIAACIGASPPPSAGEQVSAASSAPSPATDGGLGDLLARMSSTTASAKPGNPTGQTAADKPVFCPKLEWSKALALFQQTATDSPGAHRRPLAVSIGAAVDRPPVQYTRFTSEEINASVTSMNEKSVELQVTEPRESSTNPSLFPPGLGRADYSAYSVSAADGSTRARLALVVKDDTAASKFIASRNRTDILCVRGTARVLSDTSISIVVDSAEMASG